MKVASRKPPQNGSHKSACVKDPLKRLAGKAVMDTSTAIAALGRPLYPGMLYDCCRDSLIPGVSLWDQQELFIDVHPEHKIHVTFAESDTLSEKANLLDVSGSLKASFLSGLVDVGGLVKFMLDNKSSARQSRVTMGYSQTTRFEQLTRKALGHITYPQVFEKTTATHVVTAVHYGLQVFMVFDHTREETENKKNVEVNLTAVVKNIDTISKKGDLSIPMTEEQKKLADKINVTFYGDLQLEANPTTYMDALDLYKKLPTLIDQQQSKGVPLTVWLRPLREMNDKAEKLVREISTSLVDKAEKVLEELGEVERRYNNLDKNQMIDHFPDVKDRLDKFQEVHSGYKNAFHKELLTVLPAIRGGTQQENVLGNILKIHCTSPFTADKMNQWLDDMKAELKTLMSSVPGTLPVVTSLVSLNLIMMDPNVDVVVCLSFATLKYKDSYLATAEDFLKHGFTRLEKTNEVFSAQENQFWFSSPDISKAMKWNLSLFAAFSKANENDNKIKFIIMSISDSSHPEISIRLYQNGGLMDPNFQPVSKPPKPEVESSDGKVTLKFSKSPSGKTVRFRVEYRTTPPDYSATDVDGWKASDTSDAQTSFTQTELRPGEYWVRYRAVSDVGVSEASDTVSFTVLGSLNTVTVGQSWNFSTPSLFNPLRTAIMSSTGISRWSLSTIKAEVTNVVSSPATPNKYEIPGGLNTGMALYIQGVVLGKRFIIDVLRVKESGHDIAFHMKLETNTSTCCNSMKNGNWENQEFTSEFNISEGSAFDIFIVIKTEGYEVYFNGQRCYLFKHRMPLENVSAVKIHENVTLNTVGVVQNWGTSTFAKELNSGVSRTKQSNLQSDVPNPVCSPSKSYYGKIPGGLRAGVALFLQGVVPSDCDRFEINLQTGTNQPDVAFHFKSRMQSVVCNSYKYGKWNTHEEKQRGPFVKGGAFDIIIVVNPEAYEVIVNGLTYCVFKHRVPLDKVTTLAILGDVFMNNFSIIEVNDVNLKITDAANI